MRARSRLDTGSDDGHQLLGHCIGNGLRRPVPLPFYQSGTRLPPAPPLFAIRSLELDEICALSFGPADAATAARARAVTTIASARLILLNMVVLPPRHLFRWFFSTRL